MRWPDSSSVFLLTGSLLYLIGTFGVTIAFNVPRNNALERFEPTSSDATRLWAEYLSVWTAWNHVRTVAALAAAASLTIGLGYYRQVCDPNLQPDGAVAVHPGVEKLAS